MIRYQDAADPDRLAIAIAEELSAQTRFHPVETDGAIRAAGLLAEML
ncbi:MAG TPA: hypothetical protein VEI45_25440 [Mycobacterium sp.]|nr:hypothetical protein [Mycobacterium sp.]HXY67623.1 hypothetical protein [Mycobacterium sp.]